MRINLLIVRKNAIIIPDKKAFAQRGKHGLKRDYKYKISQNIFQKL